MNYHQIAFLFLQGTLVAFVILFLFRLRRRLGIGVLFTCLGLFQFMQVFLSSTVYISITDNFIVSPGSTVLFTATLFALLIIYIKEDASETKKIIYALFFTNILISIFLQIFGWSLKDVVHNPYNVSTKFFDTNAWVLFVGTVVLFIDSLLIILIFEFISKKVRFLFLQICLTMLIVVFFDTVCFSILSFWSSENLNSILISGIIAKGIFAIFYSIPFYFYLRFFDLKSNLKNLFNLKDVFQPLTYKQKFESAENEMKKAEEMYRLLANHSNDIICLQEKDNTFKYISPSFEKILGYDRSNFIGKTIFDIVHKEDLPDLKNAIEEKIFKHNYKNNSYLCRFQHKDGHFVWIEFLSSPVYKNQQISYFVTSGRDITQRVLAKKKIQDAIKLLEEKEHSLSEVSKLAKIGYWEYNSITDTITWSEYVHHIYGSNPKEKPPTQKEIVKKFEKKSRKKLIQATKELASKGTPYDLELKLVNTIGKTVWIRNLVQPVYNDQNEIIGTRGLLQDITDSKKAKEKIETALALIEKRDNSLLQASEMAKIGYWEYDLATDEYTWSDFVYKLCGLDLKDKIPLQKEIIKICDEKSLKKLEKATEELYKEGKPYDLELKLINFKNVEVWVRSVAKPIYNQQNEVIGREGVVQDITDFKKGQIELELSKQKIQESLELLEKRKYSMDEAGKLAKIGYWDVNTENNTSIWSDYVHYAIGSNPGDGIPDQSIIKKYLSKESFELFTKSTQEISLKGIPYDIEINFKNLKNEKVWIRIVAQPVYNQENKIIGRRGLLQNITESKKAEEKIQESLELLEKRKYSMDEASKIAKIGYFEHDIATDIFKWSDYLFNIYGFDPKKPVPSNEEFIKHLDKESLKTFNNALLNLYTKGVSYDIEIKFFNQIKNKTIWARSVAQPIYNDKNEIIGRRGVTQDITERKNTELRLKESEEKFFKTFKSSPNLIILTRLIDAKIIDANDAAFRLTGYTSEELKNDIEIPTSIWKSEDKRQKYFDNLIKNRRIKDYETEFITKSGEARIWKVSSEIIQISNKKYALSTIEDVTEIKQAQYELKAQSEFITAMTENQPAGIIACNAEGKLVLFNKIAKEWHGIDASEISQEKWAENYGLYKEDGETLLKKEEIPLVRAFNGENITNVEIVIIAKNQKPRTVVCNSTSFSDSDGNKLGAIIVMNDVTQQKLIENNLKRSESEIKKTNKELQRNEFLLNESGRLAKVGGWELEWPSQKIHWSKQVFDIHGVPYGKVPPLEECIAFYIDGADKIIAQAIEDSIAKKKKFDHVVRFKNRQNQKLWINSIGYPLTNEKGEVTSIIGVFQDITESKNRQDRLDAQNEELNLLNKALNEAQELSHLGSWKYIFATGEVTWSKELFNIFERSYELGAPNYSEHKKLYTEESFAIMDQAVNNCVEKQIPYNIELDIYTAKGNLKHIRSRGRVLKDKENNVIGCYGTAQDITEQKIKQKNLDAQNEKLFKLNNALNEAQEISKLGSWEYIYETDIVTWSKELYNILGFSEEMSSSKLSDHKPLYTEESFARVNEAITNCINHQIPYNIELDVYTKDGSMKHIVSRGRVLKNKDNKVIGCYGTAQDVTEEKQIRNKIKKAEEMYRLLTDNSNDLICLHKLDSTFKYISPSIKNILGYEQTELLETPGFNIIHKDDVDYFRESIENRVLKKISNDTFFCRSIHKKGHVIWLECSISVIYAGKEIEYILTSSRDVTDKVLAKKEIEEYQESLQKLTTEITLIEEKQKKEIASNIHDHLSQSLVISNMKIKELKRIPRLKTIDTELNFIYENISEALANSRKITSELSPPILYQLGIIEALHWLLENIESKHNIKYQINDNINQIKLDDVKSILLYRSVQELINNIIKYAKASKITIDLNKEKFGVNIIIKDDGVGFDTAKLNNFYSTNEKGSGFGLFTVKERIKNIKGNFEITSEINKGTTVNIYIPITNE